VNGASTTRLLHRMCDKTLGVYSTRARVQHTRIACCYSTARPPHSARITREGGIEPVLHLQTSAVYRMFVQHRQLVAD
jgi:hypothetical protein